MRSFVRRATIVGVCLGASVVGAGCEAKKATEYVAGISTQMTVPRDLKAVRVEVNVGGFQTFCQGYKVYDGKVQLPRSLGAYPNSDNALKTNLPVTYTIVGLTEDFDSASENPLFSICAQPKVGENGARILRRSRQPYVPDEILFLPMPLKYSCYDKACGEDETCKGGKCVPASLTQEQAKAAFSRYTPELVDGTGGDCFSTALCLGAAAPAIVVDADTCTYAVANTPSAPPPLDPLADPFRQQQCDLPDECGSKVCNIVDPGAVPPAKKGRCEPLAADTPWAGTNVEIVYNGGLNREILDLDPEEGFVLPDPANPQRFQLAPGLCDMVKGTAVNAGPGAKDAGLECETNADCKSAACDKRFAAPGCTQNCGVCSSGHRITSVRASGTCQAKRITQPFCAADQLAQMGTDENGVAPNATPPECSTVELKPPRAALMVVVDNTQAHSAFFNSDQIKAIEFPLKDPAFEKTDLGLIYAPVSSGGCANDAVPVLPFEPAATSRTKLIDNFLGFANAPATLLPGAPNYEGALASSYAALSALPNTSYFKRAVVIIGNRDFNTESCGNIAGTPANLAEAARTAPTDPTKPISTYVIQLAKADPNKALGDDVLDPGLFALVTAGSTTLVNPDARGTKKNAKDSFQQVINSLATCVYDVADTAKAPAADDILSFSDPLFGTTTKIEANPTNSCTTEGVPGSGWSYGASPSPGTKRIFLCEQSCAAYRSTLAQASDFALLYEKPPIAVPMFAHRKSCEPK